MINNLIVLGGGNAGLMSALYLKKSLPHLNVTVIRSEKIGTIGVGEGSTEHWAIFAEAVGISNTEIIREAGATIKSGIKFENWHGDGTSYYHSLPEYMVAVDNYTGLPYFMLRLITEGVKPEDFVWKDVINGLHPPPYTDAFSQFHFDSIKLNNLLLRHCEYAGVNLVVEEIADATLDDQGFVKSIKSKNGLEYYADFFIDSSGFNRIIASKLGVKWINWSEYLPMNSAIAFPSPYEENIPPYTLSRAMNSGWMWRSPIQNRFGNGYVYADNFINDQAAYDEIQKFYPDAIDIGRKVKFISGKVDKFWAKNCVCIGLSSSFVEPLEASSISTTIQQVRVLGTALSTWERDDSCTIKQYNELFDKVMINILDFIQLHYFTQRSDTEFWRFCNHDLKMTDFNKENLEVFKKNFINQLVLPWDNFCIYDIFNWIQVMHGLRMFDISSLKQRYDLMCNQLTPLVYNSLNTLPKKEDGDFLTTRETINMVLGLPRNNVIKYSI